MAELELSFNGINGATGAYGLPRLTPERLAALVRGERAPDNLDELRRRMILQAQKDVIEGIDSDDLSQAGWGVIFAHNAEPALQEALSDLLALRQSQAGERFRVFAGPDGYRPTDNKLRFLSRHGAAAAGAVDPEVVPYYLLIVGSPEAIPYSFQQQLDVQYATGRVCFDTLEQYANYARSVVASERQSPTGTAARPGGLAFFGAANPGDAPTQLSATRLVEPLAQRFRNYRPQTCIGADATKASLAGLLSPAAVTPPSLLFLATHGMEFPPGHPRHLRHQGALLCQDWTGPDQWKGPIPQDLYFAGDDLTRDADLGGLVAFLFACYGAGTPSLADWPGLALGSATPASPKPFVAGLAQRLLGLPKGALAVIGQVGRAWSYSFTWPGTNQRQHTRTFEGALLRLLAGKRVGQAVELFNSRYAELCTSLNDLLAAVSAGQDVDPADLTFTWTATNDARGYTLVGDPAVRARALAPSA